MLHFLVLFALDHKAVIGKGFFPHSESEFMVCSLPLLPPSLSCRRKQLVSFTEWLRRSQDDLGFPLGLKEYFTLWLAVISKPSLKCIHVVVSGLGMQGSVPGVSSKEAASWEIQHVCFPQGWCDTPNCGFVTPGNAEVVCVYRHPQMCVYKHIYMAILIRSSHSHQSTCHISGHVALTQSAAGWFFGLF